MKPGLTLLALAAAAAASLAPASADAHRVRIGVGGHVRWSAGVVVVGGTTPAPPPPVAYPTYPAPPPAPVYAPQYAPQPAPEPAYYAPPPPPPRPVFGLGLVLSSVDVDEGRLEGSGVGLVGRLRLMERFELELQLSQDRFIDDPRVDARVGVAGLVELGRPGGFSPYLLLGLGANVVQPLGERANQDPDTLPTQAYVEAGVGLAWELTRNFTLSGDLRVQARQLDTESQAARSLTSVVPDEESAAEARVNVLWYF